MKPKTIVTTALTLFVLASITALVVKEIRAVPPTAPESAGEQTKDQKIASKVVVYYCHGNMRCPTCNKIEKYADEAVHTSFARELQKGQLEWQVVNYQTAGNEHYAVDYKLAAPCVVLVAYKDGMEVGWKSLPEVWEHVGRKPQFLEFVEKNVKEFMESVFRSGPCCS